MSEKRKADSGSLPQEDQAGDKRAKGEGGVAKDVAKEKKEDGAKPVASIDNIEEDDEFQEFEVYSKL